MKKVAKSRGERSDELSAPCYSLFPHYKRIIPAVRDNGGDGTGEIYLVAHSPVASQVR